ncbi:peptidoglycan DD-metalloendopeptidase family protein [Aquimarina sp. 2304DJ70-9]|uniref:peptidoglycan DD-metalloendopeptidase family protein n=1 Tax=Aquimarina penaris TaxID=3231044 RepID=UPI003461FBDF
MNLYYSSKTGMHYGVMILLMIVLNFLGEESIAQANIANIQEVEKAFINAFNKDAVKEFRSFLDDKLKERNSLKKLNTSFNQIISQIGTIRSLTLDTVNENSYTYRSVHQKMVTLKVVFGIDDTGKVSKMAISSDYVYKDAPVLERSKSDLILPFNGVWYVFWGGKKTSDNYHNAYPSMKGAFDFWVMGSNGKSHRPGATKNEDFYAFGREIIAPVDGKILYAHDKVPDNKWPAMNANAGTGNVVLLETKNKEYIVLGHLMQNSVTVTEGQQVKQGDVLGLCGNSGKSTEPHLHFQMQNIPDFAAPKGAWVYFKNIKVNGTTKKDYIPVRGDKIRN